MSNAEITQGGSAKNRFGKREQSRLQCFSRSRDLALGDSLPFQSLDQSWRRLSRSVHHYQILHFINSSALLPKSPSLIACLCDGF